MKPSKDRRGVRFTDEQKTRMIAMINKKSNVFFVDFIKKGS